LITWRRRSTYYWLNTSRKSSVWWALFKLLVDLQDSLELRRHRTTKMVAQVILLKAALYQVYFFFSIWDLNFYYLDLSRSVSELSLDTACSMESEFTAMELDPEDLRVPVVKKSKKVIYKISVILPSDNYN
jgi:hypothetical protein